MRWLRKRLKILLCVLLFAVGVVAVGGCITTPTKQTGPGELTPLYLVSNGVHVDLAFPAKVDENWKTFLPLESFTDPAEAAQSEWLSLGQGERNFYLNTPTWDDLTFGTAVRAMCWPTATTMHIKWLPGEPIESETTRKAMIGSDQMKDFLAYIRAGFQIGEDGKVIPIPGYHFDEMNDAFFEGTGSYHMLDTCNNWTGGALKKAGVRTPLWSPFAKPLLWAVPTSEIPTNPEKQNSD